MKPVKILVIGAREQLGIELCSALRLKHGTNSVLAADRYPVVDTARPYQQVDVLNMGEVAHLVRKEKITQIYLLTAIGAVTGEQNINAAWELNMNGLLNVLRVAAAQRIDKVFWPSSIAVFGPGSPKHLCPQEIKAEPETVFGISKRSGEYWCHYYFDKFGLDVRSLRFPGLISYRGTSDCSVTGYATDLFRQAVDKQQCNSFLKEDTCLPMIYMPDAVRAVLELMDAPIERVKIRSSYNVSALSFSPCDLTAAIRKYIPQLEVSYHHDHRQYIASTLPASINDQSAYQDWGWQPRYDLDMIAADMLNNLRKLKTLQEELHNRVIPEDNYVFTRIEE